MIHYDHRETNTPNGNARVNQLGDFAVRTTLDAGNYLILETALVETKSLNEMIDSVLSGRFHDQLNRCRQQAKEVILIYEGYLSINAEGKVCTTSKDRQINWNFICNQLLSQQRSGVMIINTPTAIHTGKTLVNLHNYYSRVDHTSIGLRPLICATPNMTAQEASLTAIDGIGEDKAKALMDHFGTLHRVMMANTDDLRHVKGIGKELASNIWEFFSEEH